MSLAVRIKGQFEDLICYVLVPGLAVITPAAFSRWLLRRITRWNWVLAKAAEASLAGAEKHVKIADRVVWMRRWKRVELFDVRDLYMMLFARSQSVLAEIQCSEPIEIAKDRVLAGMHWGPGISILKLLSVERLEPAFPYRPPQQQLLRSRPFYYLYSKLAARYLSRTLAQRAVPVGGAGKILQGLVGEPGSICVLMDAPPMEGRHTSNKPVLGSKAQFNTGFPAMMADQRKEYVLYAMNLDLDGSLGKKLEFAGPFRADDAEEFLQNYANFMDRHLSSDSSQWRFWHVEQQFWKDKN